MQTEIDNFLLLVNKDLGWVGLIIFEYDESETRKEKVERIKLIRKAVTYRKYDPSKISIAIAKTPTRLEYIWLPGKKLFPVSESAYKLFKLQEVMEDPNLAFPVEKAKTQK